MSQLPPHLRALLQQLAGREPEPALTPDQSRSLTELADRTHCALFWTADPSRLAKNAERRRRLWAAYDDAAAALSKAGIEFVLLKGFTHEIDTGLDPRRRYQSDLDFLCMPQDIPRANAALQQIGYRPHGSAELSEDHLRPLVKPFTWTWKGDYYDPDLPISIELHHSLWNGRRDRVPLPEVREFWNRRIRLSIEGRLVPALAEVDRIAFAALHVLRHALRNDASPAHTFELACALNQRTDCPVFWETWERTQPPASRALQTVAFHFAAAWFGCTLPPHAELPEAVRFWFRDYAFSPLINLVQPNKDVLWLHLALLPRRADRVAVAVQRLLPFPWPGRPRRWSRIRYHAVALARALPAAIRRRPAAPSAASQSSD